MEPYFLFIRFFLSWSLGFLFFCWLHTQNMIIMSPSWNRFSYAIWSVPNYFDSVYMRAFLKAVTRKRAWIKKVTHTHIHTQSVIVKNECEWNTVDIMLNILKSHFVYVFMLAWARVLPFAILFNADLLSVAWVFTHNNFRSHSNTLPVHLTH